MNHAGPDRQLGPHELPGDDPVPRFFIGLEDKPLVRVCSARPDCEADGPHGHGGREISALHDLPTP
jgi:hypothetical protein